METGIDTEIEDEEDEESCQADTKPIPNENKHSSQYYNWSSTGTETEDDGVSQDEDYTPAEYMCFFAELIQTPVISCTISQNPSCSTRCC